MKINVYIVYTTHKQAMAILIFIGVFIFAGAKLQCSAIDEDDTIDILQQQVLALHNKVDELSRGIFLQL